jgi:menaquinone-dependent protoporphyrinogen IX oxidase
MPVLVAHATKHGSTRGIAERIAERLCAAGLTAEALPVAGVRDFRGYDAVVLGSAIYMFHWLGEARSFARRHRADLAARPLWLFSSGPLGPEPLDKGGVTNWRSRALGSWVSCGETSTLVTTGSSGAPGAATTGRLASGSA